MLVPGQFDGTFLDPTNNFLAVRHFLMETTLHSGM
jgi:hypothetical protein